MKKTELKNLLKDKKVQNLTFLNKFWQTSFSKAEKEKLKLFIKAHSLKEKSHSPKIISLKLKLPLGTIQKWLNLTSIPYIAHYISYYSKIKQKRGMFLSINSTRGGMLKGPWIKIPDKIKKYDDIKKVINQLSQNEKAHLSFAYILGFMVGDAGKPANNRKNRVTRRIQVRLTTKHKTNEDLGNYVKFCLESLNLRINKTKNCPQGKRNTHDFYSWHSQCSQIIEWMFKVCLGLKENELTTYNSIKADWILKSPKQFKIKFLQGIADSDGYIDITQFRAGIVTKPNANFIKKIFDSLNIHSNIGNVHNKTLQQVKIRLEDANKLPLFNPEVSLYRHQLMKKIMKAKKLHYHWPKWLCEEINSYLKQNISSTEIIKNVLDKHNIIIRQGGIWKRRNKIKMNKKNLTVLGIESTAQF